MRLKKLRSIFSGECRDQILTFALVCGFMAVEFGGDVFFARVFSLSEYGRFKYAATCLTLLSTIGALGADYLLVRQTVRYIATAQWGHLRGIRRGTDFLCIAVSMLL